MFGLSLKHLAIIAVVLMGAVYFLGAGRAFGWFIVLIGGLIAAYCLFAFILLGPAGELLLGVATGLSVLWMGLGVLRAAREE